MLCSWDIANLPQPNPPTAQPTSKGELFIQLARAGVKEIRFVNSRTAVDQLGRKIVFKNGTFKIL